MTIRMALTCTLALLVVSSGSLALFNSAAASPDGIDDKTTFTVRTGGIYPHLSEGGQICAEKTDSGANKVTVTDAKLKNVDIYLGKEGSVKSHISFSSAEVNGALVLYTNGENPLVNTLSLLGVCLPPGVPNPIPTTLKAYWLGVDNLQSNNLKMTSGGDPPKAEGPSLERVLKTTNTSPKEIGVNNSTDLTDRLLNNSSGEWVVSDDTAPTINNTTETDTTATSTTTPDDTETTTPTETEATATNTATPGETNGTVTNTPQTTGTDTQVNETDTATRTQSGQEPNESTTETSTGTDNTPTSTDTTVESTPTQSRTGTDAGTSTNGDINVNAKVSEWLGLGS